MSQSKTDDNEFEANTVNNTVRLAVWTFAWVATMAVSAFGPKLLWDYAILPTVLSVIVNLALGFGMILANRNYLRGLDEMHQRIFLDAGALTLGIGLVCGLSYELMSQTKLIPFEAEISHLVILMSLTFLVGLIAGNRRYG
jgi:uncharacterized membrane protein YozB (DUF420 family)